jgi:prepilin-type N-terminal cleavage/methylation domain-containing protein
LSRGFTMPELVVGIFLIGVVSLVLGRMIFSFVSLTNYTLKQTAALVSSRQGLISKGHNLGLIWAVQESVGILSLSTSTLQIMTPELSAVDYYVVSSFSTSTLVQRQGGVVTRQASGITDLHIDYFEIGSDGLIFESTAPAQATLAAFTLGVAGKGKTKSYQFYSAAQLRNR